MFLFPHIERYDLKKIENQKWKEDTGGGKKQGKNDMGETAIRKGNDGR